MRHKIFYTITILIIISISIYIGVDIGIYVAILVGLCWNMYLHDGKIKSIRWRESTFIEKCLMIFVLLSFLSLLWLIILKWFSPILTNFYS
jgi:hypothetical protein